MRLRPVFLQRVEHDFADRLAGLARQSARELRGFGAAEMNLIPRECFLCAMRCERLSGTNVPRRRRRLQLGGRPRGKQSPAASFPAEAPLATDTKPRTAPVSTGPLLVTWLD
jgi:hypothetical protein